MDRLLSFNGPLSANIYMNAGNELEHHTQATKAGLYRVLKKCSITSSLTAKAYSAQFTLSL